jgi:hypothetical protein
MFCSLLATWLVRSDVPFTSTGWFHSEPLPGILTTNSTGRYLKGNAHVVRLLSDEVRVAGRMEAWMDMAFLPDGTAIFSGPAYLEVGTWDSAGSSFTPGGGVWSLTYHGAVGADGSTQYHLKGYGIGGAIDGMRVQATAQRAAPGGLGVPILTTGTLLDAPVDRLVIGENFDNNRFTWTATGAGAGSFSARATNQQLTIQGVWQSSSLKHNELAAWANPDTTAWTLRDGQTIEARVDMVSLNRAATAAGVAIYHTAGQAYFLVVGKSWTAIAKQQLPDSTWYRVDHATIPTNNVTYVLALTHSGNNVIVSAKVLDRASGEVVVQSSFVDTPAKEPSLSSAQLAEQLGLREWTDIAADSGGPWTSGTAPLIFVMQDADGTMPPAVATFDNLQMRIHDLPRLDAEPTVGLSHPDVGAHGIEAGPTPGGPWLPVPGLPQPGLKQTTVPTTRSAEFYRLIPSP